MATVLPWISGGDQHKLRELELKAQQLRDAGQDVHVVYEPERDRFKVVARRAA